MSQRSGMPTPAVLTLPPDQVQKAWHLMVEALVDRRFPRHDAEDVVQEAFIVIIRDIEDHLAMFADIEANKGWFIRLALNRYLMMLRGDRRRRQREVAYSFLAGDPDDEVLRRGPGGRDPPDPGRGGQAD